MFRNKTSERTHWKNLADEYGFNFHTMYGEPYWDESAYYQFTLCQIEEDLESPTEELNEMCLELVHKVVQDDYWLKKFCIPEQHWDYILNSWLRKDPSLYSRLDFCYDGKRPAKLLENNADTPTSLYETGFWQWLWLEQKVNKGDLLRTADQFNSVQEKLISAFQKISAHDEKRPLYFSCCQDTDEDRATVQYLQDCAEEAGHIAAFLYIDEIGLAQNREFIDLNDKPIETIFKLYPWEFMLREDFSTALTQSTTQWIEPPWKAILSNKAILPLLWQMYPNHPNLLPAFFNEKEASSLHAYVKKPFFSREGSNISIHSNDQIMDKSTGPYGREGYIYQEYSPLPKFGNRHTLVGSWIVDNQAAGISIREDSGPITKDMSRFIPHIILG